MAKISRGGLTAGLVIGVFGCTAQLGALGDDGDGDPAGQGPGEGGEPPGGHVGSGGKGEGGGSGGGRSERPPVAPTKFECDPERRASSPPLRRLTDRQYQNTVRDLIEQSLGGAEAESVWVELASSMKRIVPDERAKVPEDLHGSYRRLDQRVQQAHVDAYFEAAVDVARALTNDARLPNLLGACITDSATDEKAAGCVEDFIRRFGALALRRPLSKQDVELYKTFYAPSTGIDPVGIADVVTGLLNAPEFLYLVESGATARGSGVYELSGYELASRLSYHFWDSMPDARLFELAGSGELEEPDVYQGEVERLWADARTHGTLREFFREWMKLEEVPELDRNNAAPVFQAFAGDDLPSAELRAAAQEEILDLLDYYTWDIPGGVSELFLTQKSLTRSAELANLYGSAPWDGRDEPPDLPEGRPGILTRAAFLSTGTPSTRPIMKGYFIRKNVLCDDVPPPPGDAAASPPELSENSTTREVVEGLTESGPCADCHQTYLNPLGFATENFDGLGRMRAEQALFDGEGQLLTTKPIDTRSVPQVILGDSSPSAGAEDLMRLLTESGKIEACFVRHYFRFSFGRFEGVLSDGCELEAMREALLETGSIADMLREVALTPAFRSRTFTSSINEDSEP